MNISRFIYPLLILISSLGASGEESPEIPHIRQILLGLEVSGPGAYLLEPEVFTGQLSAAYEFRDHWFVAAEGGVLEVLADKADHRYQASGLFLRLGSDLNILFRPDGRHRDKVILSARYGLGYTRQEAPYIRIVDPYWGTVETEIQPESIWAHWLEVGLGLQAQLAGNVYIGWALRPRLMLYQTQTQSMQAYRISGFGRNTGSLTLGFQYSLYYRIPLGSQSR